MSCAVTNTSGKPWRRPVRIVVNAMSLQCATPNRNSPKRVGVRSMFPSGCPTLRLPLIGTPRSCGRPPPARRAGSYSWSRFRRRSLVHSFLAGASRRLPVPREEHVTDAHLADQLRGATAHDRPAADARDAQRQVLTVFTELVFADH